MKVYPNERFERFYRLRPYQIINLFLFHIYCITFFVIRFMNVYLTKMPKRGSGCFFLNRNDRKKVQNNKFKNENKMKNKREMLENIK